MDEPNLNPWWRVRWRRLTRWARELFFRFDTPVRRRLWAERRRLANPYPPRPVTDAERKRLGDIGWWLGMNSVYLLTAEQEARQYALAVSIVAELRARET